MDITIIIYVSTEKNLEAKCQSIEYFTLRIIDIIDTGFNFYDVFSNPANILYL